MPSVKGSFQDIKALTDDRGQNEILQSGAAAKAIVLGFATPSPTEKFAMQIELEIHPSGRRRVPGDVRVSVGPPEDAAVCGHGSAGEDRASDPNQVAVQWDALKARSRRRVAT